MPGLVPGIHVFNRFDRKTWMVGTPSAKTRFALLPGHDDAWSFLMALRWRAKAQQCAGLVIVELAGLGPGRQAHRHDEFRGLLWCIQRHRVLSGKYRGAHAGADR